MKEKNDYVDFSDTQIAFAHKSDRALKFAALLFRMMNRKWLVDLSSRLAIFATRWRLPLAGWLIKKSIFDQFVGGETLKESQEQINNLWKSRILTVLDYGVEGKSDEEDLDEACEHFLAAVTFAASNESVPVVSIKVSALSQNELLEAAQSSEALTEDQKERLEGVRRRVDAICQKAAQLGVKIFVDAEESWMQDTIDGLVVEMMQVYNREEVVVYQTFQMYRHDRYALLLDTYQHAQDNGYKLGAKLVRGAYMEKERERAEEMGYPSPIHATKADTDRDFNRSIQFCVDHYETIASCAATHNMESCLYQAELIGDRQLPRNHPHLNFCQLYGMSDNITFNLSANGYNVAKYVVYGSVRDIVPYLTRRASENTAVQGDFGREYRLIREEMKRRGLR